MVPASRKSPSPHVVGLTSMFPMQVEAYGRKTSESDKACSSSYLHIKLQMSCRGRSVGGNWCAVGGGKLRIGKSPDKAILPRSQGDILYLDWASGARIRTIGHIRAVVTENLRLLWAIIRKPLLRKCRTAQQRGSGRNEEPECSYRRWVFLWNHINIQITEAPVCLHPHCSAGYPASHLLGLQCHPD